MYYKNALRLGFLNPERSEDELTQSKFTVASLEGFQS